MNTTTYLFMLTIAMQDKKGKEVYDEIIHNKLIKAVVGKKLKPHNFTGEAKNLIINNAIWSKEELGEMDAHESKYACPFLAARQRNKLCFKSFARSLMHLLGLGLWNAIVAIFHQLGFFWC